MEICNFYKTKRVSIVGSDLRANRQLDHVSSNKRHWCSHPNSPVPEGVVVIGQDQPLKCDGDLDQCQISKEKFAEPYINSKRSE